MKNELKKIIFILDRGRVMEKLESKTIQIFNTMIDEQKRQSENVTVTTMLCNHKYELLHDETPISEISPISDSEYWTGGKSALLDSIGNMILSTKEEQSVRNNQSEQILFVILTSGIDNASNEFDLSQIRNIIKEQQKCGWEFQFPICGMDSFFSGQAGKAYSILVNYADALEKMKIIRDELDESFHLAGEQDDYIGRYHLKDEPDYTFFVKKESKKVSGNDAAMNIPEDEFERELRKFLQEYEAK